MLAQACEALTRLPEGHMANAQQPMAYAARRSARLGSDYAAALGAAWGAHVLDTLASRLLLARRVLAGADAKAPRAPAPGPPPQHTSLLTHKPIFERHYPPPPAPPLL